MTCLWRQSQLAALHGVDQSTLGELLGLLDPPDPGFAIDAP
jgi:hypothetical protein